MVHRGLVVSRLVVHRGSLSGLSWAFFGALVGGKCVECESNKCLCYALVKSIRMRMHAIVVRLHVCARTARAYPRGETLGNPLRMGLLVVTDWKSDGGTTVPPISSG